MEGERLSSQGTSLFGRGRRRGWHLERPLAEGVRQVLVLQRHLALALEAGPPGDLLVDDLVLALRLVLPLVVAGVLVLVLLLLVLVLIRVTLDASWAANLHSAFITG